MAQQGRCLRRPCTGSQDCTGGLISNLLDCGGVGGEQATLVVPFLYPSGGWWALQWRHFLGPC